MSHITRINTQIIEKEVLLQALTDLGYRFEEGDLEIGAASAARVKVQIKVLLRLSLDIGLRQTPRGYEIVADWWGVRGVKQAEFTNALLQRYAYLATRARLEAQGFALVEETTRDGQVHLTLRRVA
jgi:hypothetical protein